MHKVVRREISRKFSSKSKAYVVKNQRFDDDNIGKNNEQRYRWVTVATMLMGGHDNKRRVGDVERKRYYERILSFLFLFFLMKKKGVKV